MPSPYLQALGFNPNPSAAPDGMGSDPRKLYTTADPGGLPSTMPGSPRTSPNPASGGMLPGASQPYTNTPNVNFNDVLSQVRQPVNAGNDYYSRAVNNLNPDSNFNNPDTQRILAANELQRQYLANQAMSGASSLASKRGIQGSSTEQFGVQQALQQTNLAAMNANTSVYSADAARAQAARDLQSQILGNQGSGLNQIQGNQNLAAGQLTSDEIASQRNMDFANRQLQVQQDLGQQGINASMQNAQMQYKLGQEQGQNSLIGAGIGAIGNIGGGYLASMGLHGAGGAAGAAGAAGGAGGTAGAAGGLGGIGGIAAIAGAGYGAMRLADYGNKVGGTAGAFLANPIGAQLNMAKSALTGTGNVVSNAGKSISNAVSNVFRF